MNPYAVAGQVAWSNRRRLAGLVAFVVVGAWLMFMLVIAAVTSSPARGPSAAAAYPCIGGGAAGDSGTGLQPDQAPNAALIVSVGRRLGVPPKGLVIAVATALQESQLKNITHGHLDSLGLFQQRPAAGWGLREQIMDPELATLAFFGGASHTANPGLLDIAGWERMSVSAVAQAVQRSAFPDAYAKWESKSVAIVEALTGSSGLCHLVSAAGVGSGPWRLPLAAGSYSASSPFGMRKHPITGVHQLHSGADLAAPQGTPVSAVHQGTVTFTGVRGTYGNLVILDHGGGVTTRYAHLHTIAVRVGAAVPVGGVIGQVGSTGGSRGNHLHLEVRVNDTAVDPVPWLRQHGVDLLNGRTTEGTKA